MTVSMIHSPKIFSDAFPNNTKNALIYIARNPVFLKATFVRCKRDKELVYLYSVIEMYIHLIMLKIPIQGLKDGNLEISLSANVGEISGMFPEFFGTISLSGILNKSGKRYSFNGSATCSALLVCDRSLTEFIEEITATITVSYLADTEVFLLQDAANNSDIYIIREDEPFIDLSVEVSEELALNLPMKRVAPQFRDKNLDEIISEIGSDIISEQKTDDRWSALKNIHLNN